MADSTSTIGTDVGDDYATLAAWYAAKKSVSGTHTGQIRNESLSDYISINDSSVTATAFIVEPQSGGEHSGVARGVSGTGSEIVNSANGPFWFYQLGGAAWTVRDICIKSTGTKNVVATNNVGGTNDVTIQRCILYGGTSGYGLSNTGTATVKIHDCIVYDVARGLDFRASSHAVGECHNNTVLGGSGYGILPGSGIEMKNNISLGWTTECYFGDDVADTNHENNLASDASADTEWNGGGGGANNVEFLETGNTPTGDYVAFVDKDFATADLELVDLGHGTYNNLALAGASTAGSGTSVNGETRDASTPDIGAWELSSGAITELTGSLFADSTPTIIAGATITNNVQDGSLHSNTEVFFSGTLTIGINGAIVTNSTSGVLSGATLTTGISGSLFTDTIPTIISGGGLTFTIDGDILTDTYTNIFGGGIVGDPPEPANTYLTIGISLTC